jgi:hypothetical protein
MHKNATKCNKTLSKWCKNKHGASKIIDTFETYQMPGPRGIIIVKGSFKLLDLCDKEFHKMAQIFGMTAEYG